MMAGSGKAHLREDAILRVEDLVVEFPTSHGRVQAVSGISFDVAPGETLGIVGESGSGKSTTMKAVLRLAPLSGGHVDFRGTDIAGLSRSEMRQLRPEMQLILQDPVSALNPRRTVRQLVAEGLRVWPHRREGEVEEIVDRMLDAVSMDPIVFGDRKPRQFSGGQCQRVAIARALALEPTLLVCDEPVSSLDVSVQAQVLDLLMDARERFDLTVVFIAHDLGVVKSIADRVMVMYLGKVCEIAPVGSMYAEPAHPYTKLLLESSPRTHGPAPEPLQVWGDPPSPIDPPSGCRFRTRCPMAEERCATEEPQLRSVGEDRFVACHFPLTETG